MIVDLAKYREEREPHMNVAAKCLSCGHEWVAVAPVGSFSLSCPECGLNRGDFVNPVVRGGEVTVYQCNCGCELFRIYDDRIDCARCGVTHDFE